MTAWRALEGVLPPIVDEDFERAAEAALADPRFVAALRRRGIEDLSIVQVDPLSAGQLPAEPARAADRLGDAVPQAAPARERLLVADRAPPRVGRPRHAARWSTSSTTTRSCRSRPPTATTRPRRRSAAGATTSRRWTSSSRTARASRSTGTCCAGRTGGCTSRCIRSTGSCCPDVRFRDGDEAPPGPVPRGPQRDGRARTATRTTASTGARTSTRASTGWAGWRTRCELGCDCLGEIRYLDAVLADGAGEPREIPNAICIHEEDAGVLWKHTELVGHGARAALAQARRVVLRHGRQLRLRLLLVAVPGRDDRARGEADRHRAHARRARRSRSSAARRASRPTSPRRTTSTCSTCGSTWRSTASRNTVHEVDLVAGRRGPGEPARAGDRRPRRRRSGASRRAAATSTRPRRGRGRSSTPAGRNHVGEPTGYKLRAVQRADDARRRPSRASAAGPASRTRTSG